MQQWFNFHCGIAAAPDDADLVSAAHPAAGLSSWNTDTSWPQHLPLRNRLAGKRRRLQHIG